MKLQEIKCRWWLTLLFLMASSFQLPAQWKAVNTKWVMTDTVYDVRSDNSLPWDRSFRFPEYFYFENLHSLQGGINCAVPGNTPAIQLPLRRSIVLSKDSSVIVMRVYTENVKGYTLWFYSGHDGQWRRKEVPLPFTGFQIPTYEPPGAWAVTTEGLPATTMREIPEGQDMLVIRTTPIDTAQPSRFIIGNLSIGYRQKLAFPVRHPFFSNLEPAIRQVSQINSDLPGVALHSEYFPELPSGMGLGANIDIVPDDSHAELPEERVLLQRILNASLEYYPYYKEKKLDKRKITWQLANIFRDPRLSDYCRLVDSLSTFIRNTFNDLHYYIDLPGEGNCAIPTAQKVKPAVRLAEINGRICIAANFDTAYRSIALNDELRSINGIPLQRVFDSVAIRLYGRTSLNAFRRSMVVNALLDRSIADTCTITTQKNAPAALSTTQLTYNKRYAVPASFRSLHADYRRIDDVAYYKILFWEPPAYMRFINNHASWSTADKLIIDLRGNGGGEQVVAMQFFALFINRPQLYFHLLNPVLPNEAVTVLPDPQFTFPPGKKVIILGDQGTGCASETFIKAMQGRPNTWYMAAGPSAGALSSKYDLRLPSGVVVHVNGLAKKILYQRDGAIIEDHGIRPDLPVTIEKVEDLRPYEDKLLKKAIKFLSADNRALPKTE